MKFEAEIAELVQACPGARGAALMDSDGIPVVTHPQSSTLEAVAAEFATVIREVDRSGREFQHGRLQQLLVRTEVAAVIFTEVARDCFLLVLLDADGSAGKARFLSRLVAGRLHADFS